MGTLDKTTYTLSCSTCGTEESRSVLDKGNMYSGSDWQDGATFAKFETTWQGAGGKTEPELVAAVCKVCGVVAARR